MRLQSDGALVVALAVAVLALVVSGPSAARGEDTLTLLADLEHDRLGPFRLGMTVPELDVACRSVGTIEPAIRTALGYEHRCRASPFEQYGARLRDGNTASILHRSWGGPALRDRYREVERMLKARYGDPTAETRPIESLTWYPARDRWIQIAFIPRTASFWGQAVRIVIGTGTGWP